MVKTPAWRFVIAQRVWTALPIRLFFLRLGLLTYSLTLISTFCAVRYIFCFFLQMRAVSTEKVADGREESPRQSVTRTVSRVSAALYDWGDRLRR